jgi:ribosomal protein S18 acetylase RimI-like enzyme
MATITAQAKGPQTGPLRPLNILHDLPQVADLIELCFSSTMDDEGQSYLRQMRRASRDNNFLRWAGQVVDSASLPLSGFVWEANGKIVGNASLIPHHQKGKKIALIANVATHPDHRRRGIARALTEQAIAYARQKGAQELWLQVRDDNPTAASIYADLGFVERARRTTYHSKPDPLPPSSATDIIITKPTSRDWPLQRAWLQRAHPDELSWYAHWNWDVLGPGLRNWIQRSIIEYDFRQWAAVQKDELLATLTWLQTARTPNMLWPAMPPDGNPAGMRSVLEAARRDLIHYHRLAVEYPAAEMVEAIRSAGFAPHRTLIWMQAKN